MKVTPVVPSGEGLRRAVRWIGEVGRHDLCVIDEACRRFDLSPLDEEFLLHYLRERRQSVDKGRKTDA